MKERQVYCILIDEDDSANWWRFRARVVSPEEHYDAFYHATTLAELMEIIKASFQRKEAASEKSKRQVIMSGGIGCCFRCGHPGDWHDDEGCQFVMSHPMRLCECKEFRPSGAFAKSPMPATLGSHELRPSVANPE